MFMQMSRPSIFSRADWTCQTARRCSTLCRRVQHLRRIEELKSHIIVGGRGCCHRESICREIGFEMQVDGKARAAPAFI